MSAKRQPAKGTTPGTRYREVAQCRLKDSAVLHSKGRFDAAVYLAGYAVECRLKYAITRRQSVAKLPADHEHHTWEKLLDTAGLRSVLDVKQAVRSAFWVAAEQWHPCIRYEVNRFDRSRAERFCKQAEAVYNWLRETIR